MTPRVVLAALVLLAWQAPAALAQTTLDDRFGPHEEATPSAGGVIVGLVLLAFFLVAVPLGQRWFRRRDARPVPLPAARPAAAAGAERAGLAVPLMRSEVEELFREVLAARQAADEARLAELVVPELLARWAEEEADADLPEVRGRVEVELLDMAEAGPLEDARAVVRVRAEVRRAHAEPAGYTGNGTIHEAVAAEPEGRRRRRRSR